MSRKYRRSGRRCLVIVAAWTPVRTNWSASRHSKRLTRFGTAATSASHCHSQVSVWRPRRRSTARSRHSRCYGSRNSYSRYSSHTGAALASATTRRRLATALVCYPSHLFHGHSRRRLRWQFSAYCSSYTWRPYRIRTVWRRLSGPPFSRRRPTRPYSYRSTASDTAAHFGSLTIWRR